MEKKLDQLFARIYTPVSALTGVAYCSPEPLSFGEKEQGVCIPLEGGTRWGKGWDCAWIRLEGEIPLPMEGKLPALLLDVGGEACLYDEKGVPLKGFTNVQSEFTVALGKPAKQAYLLPEAYYGKKVTFWVDCGANDLFGAKPENGIFLRFRLHPDACHAPLGAALPPGFFQQDFPGAMPGAEPDHRVIQLEHPVQGTALTFQAPVPDIHRVIMPPGVEILITPVNSEIQFHSKTHLVCIIIVPTHTAGR